MKEKPKASGSTTESDAKALMQFFQTALAYVTEAHRVTRENERNRAKAAMLEEASEKSLARSETLAARMLGRANSLQAKSGRQSSDSGIEAGEAVKRATTFRSENTTNLDLKPLKCFEKENGGGKFVDVERIQKALESDEFKRAVNAECGKSMEALMQKFTTDAERQECQPIIHMGLRLALNPNPFLKELFGEVEKIQARYTSTEPSRYASNTRSSFNVESAIKILLQTVIEGAGKMKLDPALATTEQGMFSAWLVPLTLEQARKIADVYGFPSDEQKEEHAKFLLLQATRNNNPQAIRALLKMGVNPTEKMKHDFLGDSPVIEAVKLDHPESVCVILPFIKEKIELAEILQNAVRYGSFKTFRALSERQEFKEYFETAQMVEIFLPLLLETSKESKKESEEKSDIENRKKFWEEFSADTSFSKLRETFLKNPKTKEAANAGLLERSANLKNPEFVELAIQLGADVNYPSLEKRVVKLCAELESKELTDEQKKAVFGVISNALSKEITAQNMRALLCGAIREKYSGATDPLDQFLGAIKDVMRESYPLTLEQGQGNTLLQQVVQQESPGSEKHKKIATLTAQGANINAQNHSGDTALHQALVRGELKTAEQLLELGANPACKNHQGQTPIAQLEKKRDEVDFSKRIEELKKEKDAHETKLDAIRSEILSEEQKNNFAARAKLAEEIKASQEPSDEERKLNERIGGLDRKTRRPSTTSREKRETGQTIATLSQQLETRRNEREALLAGAIARAESDEFAEIREAYEHAKPTLEALRTVEKELTTLEQRHAANEYKRTEIDALMQRMEARVPPQKTRRPGSMFAVAPSARERSETVVHDLETYLEAEEEEPEPKELETEEISEPTAHSATENTHTVEQSNVEQKTFVAKTHAEPKAITPRPKVKGDLTKIISASKKPETINAPLDAEGNTALHLAAGKGNVHLAQDLIAKGADPSRKNNLGQTMLDLAPKERVTAFGSTTYLPAKAWKELARTKQTFQAKVTNARAQEKGIAPPCA